MPGLSLNDGRYELQKLPLARGGMGEVWLGHDNRLNREVVVKFVRVPPGTRDEEHIHRRFDRESRITARLEHPGVPAVYDVGIDGDRPFMVMQRIRGLTVADLIAEQHPDLLPIGWVAAIAAQICSVLSAAHGEGLVHRDLKPSNVMLEPHGAVKVLDFGLATAPSDADFSRITRMGDHLGTPAYMAPEQVQSNISGPAADLYALGCTLYEMLTGTQLFTGPTSFSLMTQQVNQAPPALRARRSDVPTGLEQLIMGLLEKDPDARPASAEAVYDRLLPFSTNLGPLPGALDPPSMPSPARMYAGVLQRVFATTTMPVHVPDLPPIVEPDIPAVELATKPNVSAFTRHDLATARAQARNLIRSSKPGDAAAMLAQTEQAARRALGDADSDVVHARHELASALFETSDYDGAAPIFQALASELSTADGPVSDLAYDCRLKAAMCDALSYRYREALERIEGLLTDYCATHEDTDVRALRLRRQVGLLQTSLGERQAARRTLEMLLADLRDLPGDVEPSADEIADHLADIPIGEAARPAGPGWQEVLRYVDRTDPALDKLVGELYERGLPMPTVGYELGDEGWLAELAWPDRRVAVVVIGASDDDREVAERAAAYAAAGWEARRPESWTADEISERVAA